MSEEPFGFREMGHLSRGENDRWREIARLRDERVFEALGVNGLMPLKNDDREAENICSIIIGKLRLEELWSDDVPILAESSIDLMGIALTSRRSIKAGSKPVQWFTAEQGNERFVCALLPRTMGRKPLFRTSSTRFWDRLKMAVMMVHDHA